MFNTESTISINCFKQTKLLSLEEIKFIQNKKNKELKLKNLKKHQPSTHCDIIKKEYL